MKPIATPRGLRGYTPWQFHGTFEHLCEKHSAIKFFKSITLEPKRRLRAGQWVKLDDGEEVKLIGFDVYYLPPEYKLVKRAIYAFVGGFIFHVLDEI